ncbi:uncharacterized protein YegP (UPF0339 family)/ribosomal protein S13 [Sinorhizobium fredii]
MTNGASVAHKYEIYRDKAGEYRVRFKYNSEVLFASEGFRSKSSAQNLIDSIKNNVQEAPVEDATYEVDRLAYEEMKSWFHENFVDPAQFLPHSSHDGGYQWLNGGPYSASDALHREFGTSYPLDAINKIARELVDESGVLEWSPRADADSEFNQARTESNAETLSRHLPLAEELVSDPQSGAFNVVAKLVTKPDLLDATLSQIEDAVEDCVSSPSNGLAESAYEIRKLRRMLQKYANDPQRVEMDTTSTHASLAAKVAADELPLSDEISALLSALQQAANGIRATDEMVAENRRILQGQAMRELSQQDLQRVVEIAPLLQAITEGDLQRQMQEDIQDLSVDVSHIGAVTRADGLGPDEAVRLIGRASRIFLAMKKTPAIVDKLKNSTGFKTIEIVGALSGFIGLAVTLFSSF